MRHVKGSHQLTSTACPLLNDVHVYICMHLRERECVCCAQQISWLTLPALVYLRRILLPNFVQIFDVLSRSALCMYVCRYVCDMCTHISPHVHVNLKGNALAYQTSHENVRMCMLYLWCINVYTSTLQSWYIYIYIYIYIYKHMGSTNWPKRMTRWARVEKRPCTHCDRILNIFLFKCVYEREREFGWLSACIRELSYIWVCACACIYICTHTCTYKDTDMCTCICKNLNKLEIRRRNACLYIHNTYLHTYHKHTQKHMHSWTINVHACMHVPPVWTPRGKCQPPCGWQPEFPAYICMPLHRYTNASQQAYECTHARMLSEFACKIAHHTRTRTASTKHDGKCCVSSRNETKMWLSKFRAVRHAGMYVYQITTGLSALLQQTWCAVSLV